MKKKKAFWRVILTVSLIGCALCLGFAVRYLYRDYRSEKAYEELQEDVRKEETRKETERAETEDTGEKEGEAAQVPDDVFVDMENPIDFGKLEEINPDLYAWIRIPDTNIDYPIAQRAGDDSYYLTHDMYGETRVAGSIYTESCNKKDFSDPNTLIYGHNMKNKSMFQNLHLFSDRDFFEEHPYVYIYMPDRVLVYEIFASYTYDDRHIMHSFDFEDPAVFEQYLQDIFHVRSMDANIKEEVLVTGEDRIITLETCVGKGEKYRYLVQAVLKKDTKEGDF